jgi:hypothetical protein
MQRAGSELTENLSKAREQAEMAFGKTQSQFLARNRIVDERDAVVQARDEKTMRLRELRMAKEAADLDLASAKTPSKPASSR